MKVALPSTSRCAPARTLSDGAVYHLTGVVEGDMRNGAIVNARLKPHPDIVRRSSGFLLILKPPATVSLLHRPGRLRAAYRLYAGAREGDVSALDFELEYVASRPQLLKNLTSGLRLMIPM